VDGLWAAKSEVVGLIVRAISFQDFKPTWSWSTNVTDGQRDRQTDGRHAISIPRYALVHRAVKCTIQLLEPTDSDHAWCSLKTAAVSQSAACVQVQHHRPWMTLNGQNVFWCRKDASFGAHCTNLN